MPNDAARDVSPPASPTVWYSYALIRIVPHVERGECVNVGVVLFARTVRFLAARIALDPPRLHALAPDLALEPIARHLQSFLAICAGDPAGGPIAALAPPERFHWLTAPRSTVIQTTPVHLGCAPDPEAALDHLLDTLVRLPGREVPELRSRFKVPGTEGEGMQRSNLEP